MKSDYDIVAEAHQGIQDNLLVTAWWRANEIRDNYGLYEGSQWLQNDYERQMANNMPTRTINRIQPILDAITGFEIQNRSELKYVPRIQSAEEQGFSDLANDGVKWIQDTARFQYKKSLAMRDMLICGMGWVDTNIDYMNNPNGEAYCERIFPYFMMWDITTRSQNLDNRSLEGANWVCRAQIVDREKLHQWLIGLTPDEKDEADAEFGSAVDARFLDFFDTVMIVKSLGVIYHYQWRDTETFYRFENPLKGFEGDPNDPHTQHVVEMAKLMKDKYKCDPSLDSIIAIPEEDKKQFQKTMSLLGYNRLEYVSEKKWKYYRADIVGNQVIRKSENFTQNGFSLQCMTGKYDEIRQCYYGLVRSMKEPQRLLNKAVSDFEGFLATIPKGGVNIEVGAVKSLEGFLDTYVKAAQVTVFENGALTQGRVQPKVAPPIPDSILGMIQYANQTLMEVVGVTDAFMGQSDSKLMTAQLNSQMVRQGLMVLAPYFDALTQFTLNEGYIFLDCLRVLMENGEGILVKHVTKEGSQQFVPLLEDNLAAQYEVVVEELPYTPDEKQRVFEKLLELSGVLLNKANPIDITPLIMEFAPLDGEVKGKIKQMMAPPEDTGPDPLTQDLLQSEARLKQAQAAKQEADATRSAIEAMLKQKELENYDAEAAIDMKKKAASADYDQVRSVKELGNLDMDAMRMHREHSNRGRGESNKAERAI